MDAQTTFRMDPALLLNLMGEVYEILPEGKIGKKKG